MPTKWMKRFKESGQLTIYNKAGAWSSSVDAAINTFNNLGFGVKLVKHNDEYNANIVVKLSMGSENYNHAGDTIAVNFPAEKLHGRAVTVAHPRLKELYFAAVFLPGKVKNVTARQKEVMVVHELIHASGLDGGIEGGGKNPDMDHDDVGIMTGLMKVEGDGLIEYLPERGATPMTPIRVGTKTIGKMKAIWG